MVSDRFSEKTYWRKKHLRWEEGLRKEHRRGRGSQSPEEQEELPSSRSRTCPGTETAARPRGSACRGWERESLTWFPRTHHVAAIDRRKDLGFVLQATRGHWTIEQGRDPAAVWRVLADETNRKQSKQAGAVRVRAVRDREAHKFVAIISQIKRSTRSGK